MKYFGNPSSFRVSVEGVAFTSLLPPYVLFRFTIRICFYNLPIIDVLIRCVRSVSEKTEVSTIPEKISVPVYDPIFSRSTLKKPKRFLQ